jgi:hypothetical protein
VGVVCPIYYFFSYVFTPLEKFKAVDMRLGRRNYAVTVLPMLVLLYYVPLFSMFDWPTLPGRESWLFFWQMFPVWISVGTALLSRLIPDTTAMDRFTPNRDLPVLTYSIGILSALSSAVWIWTTVSATDLAQLLSLFTPVTLPPNTNDYIAFTREFLKLDEISLFGNTFLWLGYFFWDMKSAGMIQASWFRLTIYLVSSVIVLGPGATAGLGWLWREYTLATKRHKDAVTEDKLLNVQGQKI